MKERPILFNSPMVRALLNGWKTQTRRIVKLSEFGHSDTRGYDWTFRDRSGRMHDYRADRIAERCPYGLPGDRLWVRETARVLTSPSMGMVCVRYEADGREAMVPWPSERLRPVAPMACIPNGCHREAARITLEITDIRVERMQEISRGDAMAEGCPFQNMMKGPDPRQWFRDLWEPLNGAGSWAANPWVWVVDLKLTKART